MLYNLINIGERKIIINGIGKLFYEKGFPLSISVDKLSEKGIEVSLYHIIEEFWNNGWSWKTIENKLRGEVEDDKRLVLDFEKLKYFYECLEQPKRANGGYEESREIIFKYLFSSEESAKKYLMSIFERSEEEIVR